MSHPDDEGPSDREASRKHVKALLEKPEHKADRGDPRDEATRDDDAIDDPGHQKPDK